MTAPIGNRIRELRAKRVWSQEQLADIAGVSLRTIQRLEAGSPASMESVRAVAAAMDLDAQELLAPEPMQRDDDRLKLLVRMTYGVDLLGLVASSHAYQFQHPDLAGTLLVGIVGDFLQDLFDWAEIWSDIGPAEHVRICTEFTERIFELAERGIWVFATKDMRNIVVRGEKSPWAVAVVLLAHSNDPTIVRFDAAPEALPAKVSR